VAQRCIGTWQHRDGASVLLRSLAVINVREEEIPDQTADAGYEQQYARKPLARRLVGARCPPWGSAAG